MGLLMEDLQCVASCLHDTPASGQLGYQQLHMPAVHIATFGGGLHVPGSCRSLVSPEVPLFAPSCLVDGLTAIGLWVHASKDTAVFWTWWRLRPVTCDQVLREMDMPEKPTFHPIWPLPGAGAGQGGSSSCSREEVCVQGRPVRERLATAALAIPGGLRCWDVRAACMPRPTRSLRPMH